MLSQEGIPRYPETDTNLNLKPYLNPDPDPDPDDLPYCMQSKQQCVESKPYPNPNPNSKPQTASQPLQYPRVRETSQVRVRELGDWGIGVSR